MGIQLYMWSGLRQNLLTRHDFYVEQIKSRVFAQFQDIEGEADRFAETEYARLGSSLSYDEVDMSTLADTATERSYEHYSQLSDLKMQMLLGGLAGLYHQWDKDLRDFLDRELHDYLDMSAIKKHVWKSNLNGIIDVLEQFGWNLNEADFFSKIEACNLIVNVYKHGKGDSLDSLAKRFPQYLETFTYDANFNKLLNGFLRHEWLQISETQFDEIASAFREFWQRFPERLFLKPD